jgi:uncharacterized protein YaiL (DUF2058 family)
MKRSRVLLLAVLGLVVGSTANAQMYKWVDRDGKVRYGDTPPSGANASTVKPPPAGVAVPAPASKEGDKKGPLTPEEQAQAFRMRQAEAKTAAEKAEREQQEKAAKDASCEQSRAYLRTLQSGQRISRTNASGERYFLDDGQVAQEVAKEQHTVQAACK